MMRFASDLAISDPLQTAYQFLSGHVLNVEKHKKYMFFQITKRFKISLFSKMCFSTFFFILCSSLRSRMGRRDQQLESIHIIIIFKLFL